MDGLLAFDAPDDEGAGLGFDWLWIKAALAAIAFKESPHEASAVPARLRTRTTQPAIFRSFTIDFISSLLRKFVPTAGLMAARQDECCGKTLMAAIPGG